MPLNVLCSSRTEILVEDLVEALSAPGDPGLVRGVLLPSRPLVERVTVALARARGVAMGVDFLLPGAFFDRIAGVLNLEPLDPAWQPQGLFWRLLGPVRELAARPGSRLASARDDERALVSLTRQIADRFDQYMHYRPAMIRAWDEGKAWSELPEEVLADEDWQRELWHGLVAQGESLPRPPHLVARFEAMQRRLEEVEGHPFGASLEALSTGPLPGGMLEMLELLGRRCTVNLRMLMPSREYLKHIKSVARQRRAGEEPSVEREGHPLLASMGQQAVDSFCALDDLLDRCDGDFTILDPDTGFEEGSPASLLGALQDDIRAARQPDPRRRPLPKGADASLRVHRCHGPRRELEVLRDELLRAFDDLEGLRAEDVMVLSPDLEAHVPLAGALLGAPGYEIPLAFAETSVELEDPLLAALAALLSFAAGRAPLSEGLGLLALPAAVRVLGEEGSQDLAARLERSGITFGLDAAHRADLGAGSQSVGTWRFGLERVAQGLWLGAEEEAERPDGEACLPQAGDLSSGRGEPLRALRWFDAVLALAQRWRGEQAGPRDWERNLREAAGLFEHPETLLENLDNALEWFERAAGALYAPLPLGPGGVADVLAEAAKDEARKVRAVGGRLALGGLKPLRALPCRVLALLGLSDAAFPRRNNAPAWDLMAAKHCSGDRDPREEDRQLFLDALLSAGERVIITVPGRHAVTDKQLPFSVCVDELIRCAAATGAIEPPEREALARALVKDHPLQAFSPANFGEGASFDRANRGLAEALLEERRPLPFAPESLEARPSESAASAVDTAGLLDFLLDPAEAWLRVLGLRVPQALEGADSDDEPMDMDDGLRRWQLTQASMEQAVTGEAGEAALRQRRLTQRLAADRLLPYGDLGAALALASSGAVRESVGALLERSGGLVSVELVAQLSEALRGSLRLAAKGGSLVLLTPSAWDRPRVLLGAFIQACLAAAGGRSLPTLAVARQGSGASASFALRSLEAVPGPQATAYLEGLLALRRRGLLCQTPFDPDLSLVLAELKDPEQRLAWDLARALSHSRSLALCARDRDPFEGAGWDAWTRTAQAVYGPALKWAQPQREADHA